MRALTCAWQRHALRLVWLVTLYLSACQSKPELLPAELVGTWISDAPAYAGRSFTFRAPSALILQFGAGEDSTSVRRIRAVDGKFDPGKNATLYRVEYNEGRDVLYFSLYVFNGPTRIARFKNQPDITWKPHQDGVVFWP